MLMQIISITCAASWMCDGLRNCRAYTALQDGPGSAAATIEEFTNHLLRDVGQRVARAHAEVSCKPLT